MGKSYKIKFKNNPNISIDRIDSSGHYSQENCRWTDSKTQMNNRSYNVNITYKNRTQTVSQWAEELDIKRTTIYQRIRRGVENPEEILSKPLRTWNCI